MLKLAVATASSRSELMADVQIRSVVKSYGESQILKGIDLDIQDGEFVVFVGPSGCGKSTLLRSIAGLEEVNGGELRIGGRVVNDVPPAERGIAMVFQSYALYPHMNLFDNMAFGLKLAKVPKAEIEAAVMNAARILHIDYLERMGEELLSRMKKTELKRRIEEERDALLASDKRRIYERWASDVLTDHLRRLIGRNLAAQQAESFSEWCAEQGFTQVVDPETED
jgi:ABC-type Fe3+/spermidine/putrescine transport system ATPase subunit